MNTFALATLTLSTLCLGGAFAAIVTARHVRLRRDAEDRRALGRVLEEVDRQLVRLAAAEESSATAQIVGRLTRLDERIGTLVAESAESSERIRRAEEARLREHEERPALRLTAPTGARTDEAAAELLDGAASGTSRDAAQARDAGLAADDFGDDLGEEPRAEIDTTSEDDDPELAALLAKFDDDAFSFRSAARSKVESAAGSNTQAPTGSTATLERPLPGTLAEVPLGASCAVANDVAGPELAAKPVAHAAAALQPSADSAATEARSDGGDAQFLEPAGSGGDDAADDVSTEAPTGDSAKRTANSKATGTESADDLDDELELDDLVLFFHEDDQGEPSDSDAEDVALFDEEQLLSTAREPAAEHAPASEAAAAATPVATAPLSPRPSATSQPELRHSIDELRSLTERLCVPQRDRGERLRLVTELRDALARVRR